MKRLVAILAVLVSLILPGTSQADGLFIRLPEDGTWAKYDLTIDGPRTTEGELIVKSVGKETVEGVECRWVEVILDGPTTVTLRALVPESELKLGGSPVKSAKRMYFDEGEGDGPAKIDDAASSPLGPFVAFLGGPMDDAEELEAESVQSDAGEFSCPGVKGTYELPAGFAGTVTVDIELRYADEQQAGFGVVDYKLEFNAGGQTGSITAQLKEIGEGAESEIAGDIADGEDDADQTDDGQSDGGI